jgi:hypothetical protein
VPTRVWTLRLVALIGAGTFAVHQLRYALSYGHEVGGHGYLVAVGPVIVAALLVAFAVALGRVARGAEEPAPRLGRLWAGTSASLFGAYCLQESVESLLNGGVPGMLEHGGWVALPLAAAVGLAIALIMRSAAAATALAHGRAPWQPPARVPSLQSVLPPWTAPRTRASARHLAARGPPAVA